MSEHLCIRCAEPITEGERWEYSQGYAAYGQEQTARRIHSRCVAELLRETLRAFARVPEDKREEITFEI